VHLPRHLSYDAVRTAVVAATALGTEITIKLGEAAAREPAAQAKSKLT
jgi:hypothetical protein